MEGGWRGFSLPLHTTAQSLYVSILTRTQNLALFVLYGTAMRPKTRKLAQHGGPPGWLEGRCDFVRDGPACLFLTVQDP
jgi:hypothetical protein